MGKTDNTDPYEIQAQHRSLPGYIRHRHLLPVIEWERNVPVTWRMLIAHMREREDLVLSLLTEQPLPLAQEAALDSELLITKLHLDMYLPEWERVPLKLEKGETIAPHTLVGHRSFRKLRILELSCDYHPSNGIVNRLLAQSIGNDAFRYSIDQRRCTRETKHYGGCHRENWHFKGGRCSRRHPNKANRRLQKKAIRRSVTMAMHQVAASHGALEIELPRYKKTRGR